MAATARRALRAAARAAGDREAARLLARNAVVMTLALALPFLPSVQRVAGSSATLIPILTLVLGLKPRVATCVGAEIELFGLAVLMWPATIACALVLALVAPLSLAGFLCLFFIVVFIIMLAAGTIANWILVGVLCSVSFSFMMPVIFHAMTETDRLRPGVNQVHLASEDAAWASVLSWLGKVSFSVIVAFAMHCLGALTIFPTFAEDIARSRIAAKWPAQAALLAELRSTYGKVARETLFPGEKTKFLFLAPDDLPNLEQARDAEIASTTAVQTTLMPALLETRWRFSGAGLRLVETYKRSLKASRIARSCADDLLQKYRRMEAHAGASPEYSEWVAERQQMEEAATAAQFESHSTVREDIVAGIDNVADLLIQSCGPIATLVAHRTGDTVACREAREELGNLQPRLEAEWKRLDAAALQWAKVHLRLRIAFVCEDERLNDDEPLKRTKLMTYVLLLQQLVRAQARVVELFPSVDKAQVPAKPGPGAATEWAMTLLHRSSFISVLEHNTLHDFAPPVGLRAWLGEISAGLDNFVSGVPFRLAAKFALGTTILTTLACLPTTSSRYSEIELVNGVFAFQVILYKTQTGPVLERTAQRIGGMVAAVIYAGICGEIVCTQGCNSLDGWALFLLSLPALWGYLAIMRAHPSQGYFGFAMVRTYSSLVTPFAVDARVGEVVVDPPSLWATGGWVLLSSLIGAGLALFLGLLVWPTSGRSELRHLLGNVLGDLMLLYERIIHLRYTQPATSSDPDLDRAETHLARTLYVETVPLLRAARLESSQGVNWDAPFAQYAAAVRNTQLLWRSLWKFHHVGGIRAYLRDASGAPTRTVRPSTARALLEMNRILSSTLALLAGALRIGHNAVLPALRPVGATPHLLRAVLDDTLVACFKDDLLMARMLESDDLHLLLNLIVFRDTLIDMSEALASVYEFVEHLTRRPRTADQLKAQDTASYMLYTGAIGLPQEEGKSLVLIA